MTRTILVLSLLTSAACTVDPSDPVLDYQVERALQAASAADASTAAIMAIAVSGRAQPGCPRIETTGDTSTATGPCVVDETNAIWDGSLIATNVRGLSSATPYDPTRPSHLRIAHAYTTDGSTLSIDGAVDWDPGAGIIDVVLTVDEHDVRSRAELHLACDPSVSCLVHDSTVDVEGLGHFELADLWQLDLAPGSTMVLTGTNSIYFERREGAVDYRMEDGRVGAVSLGTNQAVFLR